MIWVGFRTTATWHECCWWLSCCHWDMDKNSLRH